MAFNIPDSFKKVNKPPGNDPGGGGTFRRRAVNYNDLDDFGTSAAGAAENVPSSSASPWRMAASPNFSLRRAADGSLVPPRTVTGFPPQKVTTTTKLRESGRGGALNVPSREVTGFPPVSGSFRGGASPFGSRFGAAGRGGTNRYSLVRTIPGAKSGKLETRKRPTPVSEESEATDDEPAAGSGDDDGATTSDADQKEEPEDGELERDPPPPPAEKQERKPFSFGAAASLFGGARSSAAPSTVDGLGIFGRKREASPFGAVTSTTTMAKIGAAEGFGMLARKREEREASPFGTVSTTTAAKPTTNEGLGSFVRKRDREDSPFGGGASTFGRPEVSTRIERAAEKAADRMAGGRGGGGSARTIVPVNTASLSGRNDVLRALRALQGRPCPGDFDRYQLLDERDKLMCKLREFDPSAFKSKTGTCPDLCPEKERYVRIVQKRVASYETDPLGEMDPTRTVKEYARSAADQEQPLPHEMRPGPVLVRAMEYLLTEIVDAMPPVSDAAGSWYDFLWNRTRAIRKECTQQSMTNETGVVLIERCSRLHIFAAYSLCTLGHDHFSPKMNDENLGKCLQSLRHLYEDLAKKEIFCPTEAEFRAYDVMMHLQDTNILRQVLSYRKEVRESAPVRLALKLFSAFQSNNYVRFFRLLREQATFLQCAVVHRYFEKVRLEAWAVLTKAHQRHSLYPIAAISKHLAFDSETRAQDAAGLLGMYGADGEESMLQLDRDIRLVLSDSLSHETWVDAKRGHKQLSEILRGAPALGLKMATSSTINSFDARGAYINDPVLAAVLGTAVPERVPSPVDKKPAFGGLASFGTKPAPSFGGPTFPLTAKPVAIANGTLKKDDGGIFGGFTFGGFGGGVKKEEVLAEDIKATTRAEAEERKEVLVAKLADSVVDECTRATSEDVLREERLARERQLKEERERKAREQEEEQRRKRLAAEAEAERIRVKQAEAKKALLARTAAWADSIGKKMWSAFLDDVVDTLAREIVYETFENDRYEVELGLRIFRDNMRALWLRQFTDQWKKYAQWRKEQREKARQVMMATVSRRPDQILRLTGSSPAEQAQRADLTSRARARLEFGYDYPYAHLDTQTALAAVCFEKRRKARIVLAAFEHWCMWTRRRRERRATISGGLARIECLPALLNESLSGLPSSSLNGSHSEMLASRSNGRPKSRRSVGMYSFLNEEDSFLAEPATPEPRPRTRRRTESPPHQFAFARPTREAVVASREFDCTAGESFDDFLSTTRAENERDEERERRKELDYSWACEQSTLCGWTTGEGVAELSRRATRRKREGNGDIDTVTEWKKKRQSLPAPGGETSWAWMEDRRDGEDAVYEGERRDFRAMLQPEPLRLNAPIPARPPKVEEKRKEAESASSRVAGLLARTKASVSSLRAQNDEIAALLAKYKT